MRNGRYGIRERFHYAVASAAAPIIYILLFFALIFLWHGLGWPPPEEVYKTIVDLYWEHGVVVVSFAAFAEGIVLITLYFPGSAVILIGVATSKGEPLRAALIVLIVTIAFIGAAQINYILGYLGLHRIILRLGGRRWLLNAQARYNKYGTYIVPPSFVHPTFSGFMAVTCGLAQLNWSKFTLLSALGIVFWDIFWGITAYRLSETVREVATRPILVIIGLFSWILIAFIYGFCCPKPDEIQDGEGLPLL
jgi:membrane protein DedA with SNARE-associated domain